MFNFIAYLTERERDHMYVCFNYIKTNYSHKTNFY